MLDKIQLKNLTTEETLELTKNDSTEGIILDNEGIDWGEVEATLYTYKSPNQVGVTLAGTELETRNITIVGWLYGTPQKIATLQSKLGRLVNPLHKLRLTVEGYYIDGVAKTLPWFGTKVKENNPYMCKFLINLFCMNPEFTRLIPDTIGFQKQETAFRFPFHFTEDNGVVFSIRELLTLQEIVNSGVNPTGGIIRLKCIGDEPVVNPKLYNIYNPSEYIKINKTIAYGEEVNINTRKNEQDITGIIDHTEFNYFQYLDFNSKWIQFPIGSSFYSISADSGMASLQCSVELNSTTYVIGGM